MKYLTSRLEGDQIFVAHLFVAERVEASWASLSPERKYWIARHPAHSERCHSRKRLRSSSPNFISARRSRWWLWKTMVKNVLPSTSVASATTRPKTRRPRDYPESPGIMQTSLPGFHSLQAEKKTGKESLSSEEASSRKSQSTTSTTWWKERSWLMHVGVKNARLCFRIEEVLYHAYMCTALTQVLKLRHRTDDVACEDVLSFDVCKTTETTKRSRKSIYCDV